jgi:hypothetical protein
MKYRMPNPNPYMSAKYPDISGAAEEPPYSKILSKASAEPLISGSAISIIAAETFEPAIGSMKDATVPAIVNPKTSSKDHIIVKYNVGAERNQ